jgi:hypothetical protein
MSCTDSTTTLLNNTNDEDKTLILTTKERLQYFSPTPSALEKPLSKQNDSIWFKIRTFLH